MHQVGGTFSAKKRPFFLSQQHKEARVEFSKELLSNGEDWKTYVFVDEKKFKMDGPDGYVKKWSIPGVSPPEPQRSREYRKTVMVFAGINYYRKTSIQWVHETWKAVDYANALKKMFKQLRDADDSIEYILYQDNASIHTAKLTKNMLEQEDIPSVKAPARSPYMNAIENAWGELSCMVYRIKPSYDSTSELRTSIEKCWSQMSQKYIEKLCTSEPRRLVKVLCASGERINY
ncbi:MAG: putative Transposable element Tc3 transposase [Streblomastix strix]|uniref:Putative Transposable element Tc3 transposase n=1 Tax=Streblomastix strix TaxID=222440 RepID=A0A5J4UIB3_9EUKA|nr:MAG: putative Transposable element Tc3 transposase [Streblomastix strix]